MKIFVCDAFSSEIFKGNQAGVVILDEKENYPDETSWKYCSWIKTLRDCFCKKNR